MNRDKTLKLIVLHESYRQFVYSDTTGNAVKSSEGKLTIGYGRNLEDRGLSIIESRYLLNNDIDYFNYELPKRISFYSGLDDVRQAVLIDMAFNLGLSALINFKNTIDFIKNRKYKEASIEMLNSKWAEQVKSRASNDAQMMETGEWPKFIGS